MKALYIYNPHTSVEIDLIERANSEMGSYITCISLDEVSVDIKSLVSKTPALIIITDDLQGENLLKENVDGQLLATASLYKRLDEEEKTIHNQENQRLDAMINNEKNKVKDSQMLELIEGGLI